MSGVQPALHSIQCWALWLGCQIPVPGLTTSLQKQCVLVLLSLQPLHSGLYTLSTLFIPGTLVTNTARTASTALPLHKYPYSSPPCPLNPSMTFWSLSDPLSLPPFPLTLHNFLRPSASSWPKPMPLFPSTPSQCHARGPLTHTDEVATGSNSSGKHSLY